MFHAVHMCFSLSIVDDWPVPRKHVYGKLHWQRPNKMQNFLSRIPISAGVLPTSTSWTSKSQNDDDVLIPSNYCSTLQQQQQPYLFWSIHEEYLIGFLCKNLHSSLCEHLDLFDKTVGLPTNVHDRIKAMVPSTKCISNFYCCYFLFSLLLSQSTVASRITLCWSRFSFICIHNRIYSKSPKSNIWFNTQSTSCCVWNGHFYFSLKCE